MNTLQAGWIELRKNRAAVVGAFILLALLLAAIFAPALAPYGYDDQALDRALQPPSRAFPLGTDDFGRDVLSRTIYGAQISLLVGFVATLISMAIGLALGLMAGMSGGAVDMLICTLIDVAWSFPTILLALFLVAVLGAGFGNVILAVGLSNWAGYARVVRGQVLALRDQQFVEAARATGAGNLRIAFLHFIPNILAPVIVLTTLGLAQVIVAESSLSYLGLGVQRPIPSWGSMLSAGRVYITSAWWISTFPGLAIMLSVLGFNLLGDGLRDALDPRLRQ